MSNKRAKLFSLFVGADYVVNSEGISRFEFMPEKSGKIVVRTMHIGLPEVEE